MFRYTGYGVSESILIVYWPRRIGLGLMVFNVSIPSPDFRITVAFPAHTHETPIGHLESLGTDTNETLKPSANEAVWPTLS